MSHGPMRVVALVFGAGLCCACGGDTEAQSSQPRSSQPQSPHVTTVQSDPPAAAALEEQERECEGGALDACHSLGNMHLQLARYAEAERVWKDACDAGHGESCADLGYQYNNPFIEMPHPEWAMDVLTRGCEAPEHPPIACASLAERYEDERYGVPADPARRAELLARACRDGHYWSCQEIGEDPP